MTYQSRTATPSEMVPKSQIGSLAISESLLTKKRQAQQLMEKEESFYSQRDPTAISKESSRLVLSVLYKYFGIE